MSNRDIAQALFVTIKTVETHIGHIYQKLNVTRRTQLGGALADGATSTNSVPTHHTPTGREHAHRATRS